MAEWMLAVWVFERMSEAARMTATDGDLSTFAG